MAKGIIESSLDGITDKKDIARLRSRGILEAFQALPRAQRQSFVFDGMQVTIMAPPAFIHDKTGNIIGFELQASAKIGEQALPFSDGIHRVINPPTQVPTGRFNQVTDEAGTIIEVPELVEDPILAMKMWLVESIRTEAKAAGWKG